MQEAEIRKALDAAKERGIAIRPGATFDWSSGRLGACNVLGAILLAAGLDKVKKGWLGRLGVDYFWVHRLLLGFDQRFQMMFWKEKEKEWVEDSVSKMGRQLRKEYATPPKVV